MMSQQVNSLHQPQRLLRINTMIDLLGCSRTTLYRWVQDGMFPVPKMRGSRTLGWTVGQYEDWLAEQ